MGQHLFRRGLLQQGRPVGVFAMIAGRVGFYPNQDISVHDQGLCPIIRVYNSIVSDNPDMKYVKQKLKGNPELRWYWCRLEEMKPFLLYDMLALREAIFVVEQTCAYLELDGLDKTAEHLLVTRDETVVSCLRVLPPVKKADQVRIGRVAVSVDWRKRGLAGLMVQSAIDKIRLDYPSSDICLDAQTYLQKFYLSLGFEICGDEFLEDGIPHIPMQM